MRTQLWPLPTMAVVAAVALGLLVPRLDASVDASLSGWLDAVLFGGDGGAASTVLDAVSSSLITVTSLTFSLTVVTLQLASSQFSPRLLRTFTKDLFVQGTLALFLATFAYSLTVLRSVRSGDGGQTPFVPRIAVTTSYVLAMLSVIGLVLFLAHLTRQIRVETMLHQVRQDASDTVRSVLPPRGEGRPGVAIPDGRGVPLLATSSGFLLGADTEELLRASREASGLVVITSLPGDFIIEGTPVGALHRASTPDPTSLERVRATVGAALRTGTERTAAEDVAFGLRQLTDVANKALSPGINDPTTAVHALGHISTLLCELADAELGPVTVRSDDGGQVVLQRPDLDHLLEVSLTQIRRYGAGDPLVLARLYRLLTELAWHVSPEDAWLVARERRRLDATVEAGDGDEVTRARLAQLSRDVAATAPASGRESPPPPASTSQSS
ncbi:MAG: DUF2254 domain-containing protein [Humibacillus sp.]